MLLVVFATVNAAGGTPLGGQIGSSKAPQNLPRTSHAPHQEAPPPPRPLLRRPLPVTVELSAKSFVVSDAMIGAREAPRGPYVFGTSPSTYTLAPWCSFALIGLASSSVTYTHQHMQLSDDV